MANHPMTIAGELVSGLESFDVIDPALGTPFASAPECSALELDRAMDAARVAFRSWRKDEALRRQALACRGERRENARRRARAPAGAGAGQAARSGAARDSRRERDLQGRGQARPRGKNHARRRQDADFGAKAALTEWSARSRPGTTRS